MHSKIFLSGFMGSGKTFWGRIWAKEYHLDFFDLDHLVEKDAGETVAGIFESKGEEFFREMEKSVLDQFAFKNNFILACGGGTPCFYDNLKFMNEQGITIYLEASPNEIFQRIKNEIQVRPLLSKVNEVELLFFIEQKLKEREPFYKQAKHTLKVDALTNSSLVEILYPMA